MQVPFFCTHVRKNSSSTIQRGSNVRSSKDLSAIKWSIGTMLSSMTLESKMHQCKLIVCAIQG